jgi:hypothetical protein
MGGGGHRVAEFEEDVVVAEWLRDLEVLLRPLRVVEAPFAVLSARLEKGWYEPLVAAIHDVAPAVEDTDLNYGRCRHLLLNEWGCQVWLSLWGRLGCVARRLPEDNPSIEHLRALEGLLAVHGVRVVPSPVLEATLKDIDPANGNVSVFEVLFREA